MPCGRTNRLAVIRRHPQEIEQHLAGTEKVFQTIAIEHGEEGVHRIRQNRPQSARRHDPAGALGGEAGDQAEVILGARRSPPPLPRMVST
jgi:hypothetical protein